MTIGNVGTVLFAVRRGRRAGHAEARHAGRNVSRVARSRGSLVVSAATSPWVLLGLVVFGVSAVAWLAALSRVPLSVAYPFNALGYLGHPDREHPRPARTGEHIYLAGSVLVVSGLIIVVSTAKP